MANGSLVLIRQSLPIPPLPLATSNLHSDFMDLPIPGISYKWDHGARLASFHVARVLKFIHVLAGVRTDVVPFYSFIPFYSTVWYVFGYPVF